MSALSVPPAQNMLKLIVSLQYKHIKNSQMDLEVNA